jgi:AraC-like DNA-binding protein
MISRGGSGLGCSRGAGENEQVETVNEGVRGVPAAALRPFIAFYSGYRQAGVEPAVHRGMPSPYLTLIFTLDEPLTVASHPDPGQPGGEFTTLLGGLHTVPAIVTHQGWQSGIQVALSPLGARPLLGLPAGELAHLDVPAADVLGPLAAEIQQRAQSAATWPERFAVVDQVLLRQLAARSGGGAVAPKVSDEVGYAWRLLLRTGGAVRVSELADGCGWSTRHLHGRLQAETGLSPKAAARVIRFDRARRLLLRRRATAPQDFLLSDLAADCGYYDQPHLDRDFRVLAGLSPTKWLAEEFRNVQAIAGDDVPGSPHDS